MKLLWLATVGLAVVFTVIWAAGRPGAGGSTPAVSAPPVAESNGLADKAKGDAASRVPGDANLTVKSVKPGVFRGSALADNPLAAGVVHPGFTVVLGATVAGKTVDTLTYHVAPPDLIVFVKQEPVH